jgi:murein DD-endopeptidase MepM/ murein hydrolase activator NlpD
MKSLIAVAILTFTSSLALAETKVTVEPKSARPGDAILVTVTGATEAPKGDAGGIKLQFFPARNGRYQAVFAVPIDAKDEAVSVEIESAKKPARVAVRTVTFPDAKIVVEDEYANPPAAERTRIDEDNKAILAAMAKSDGMDPAFAAPFRRPAGTVTSMFGEWRTFNDGHRSQHLGMDVNAKEGARVNTASAGTVTLVRDTFLAGNIVVVAHGAGMATAYFHLSATTVAEGDVIAAGAEVGKAGKTGRATGPHLHISARVPGGMVDPASVFRLKLAPAAAKAVAAKKP